MNYRSFRTFLGQSMHYKKYLWPINAFLFNMCRLYPFRDKRLWIFGALGGKKYDDNSRFLYEYIKGIRSSY